MNIGKGSMIFEDKQNIFFLGIGGIGMSALALYLKRHNYAIYGYDRTLSDITDKLETEGIIVTQSEEVSGVDAKIDYSLFTSFNTVVIYTPAIDSGDTLFRYFVERGIAMYKRSEALGEITRSKKSLCVAGTHGKTTISSMMAHIMRQSHVGVSAFLGGISNNYGSNVFIDEKSPYVVVEADEFDHSFHRLSPYMSVVSAIDADHLDIYGDYSNYIEGFHHYMRLVSDALIINKRLLDEGIVDRRSDCEATVWSYGVKVENNRPDFYATDICMNRSGIRFNFGTPEGILEDMELSVPIWVNVENAVAALAMACLNGVEAGELRNGLKTYRGVKRRFDILVNTERATYIDDYAHHPEEIRRSVESIKMLFPNRPVIVIFQPHLYSRTRDFAHDFAQSLSLADKVILLPIYPAREAPIEGVSSSMIACEMSADVEIVEMALIENYLKERIFPQYGEMVLVTLGAGNIGNMSDKIKEWVRAYYE